jgi:hypothetical protein
MSHDKIEEVAEDAEPIEETCAAISDEHSAKAGEIKATKDNVPKSARTYNI